MYFCTAADDKHFPILLNMIGSIHLHNFYDVEKILVYDLGLSEINKTQLQNIKKVELCEIEATNPDILTDIETGPNRKVKGLFSWKPVVIKDALDKCPYVLYLDSGTTVLKPLNDLFKHIEQNGYLLLDCGKSIRWMATKYVINKFDLESDDNRFLLDDDLLGIDAGFQGVSRKVYDEYVLPMYELSKDIKNFEDDGTSPNGWGMARHDQTLFSIQARKLKYNVQVHDNDNIDCNLFVDGNNKKIHITHDPKRVTNNTVIFRSRWNIQYDSYKLNASATKRKYIVSIVTGIGPLEKYEKFVDSYFSNLQQQNIDDLRFPINNKVKYDVLSKNVGIDLAYNWYVAASPEEIEAGKDLSTKAIQAYPDDYHLHTHVACMAGPDPLWRKTFHLFGGLFNYKDYSIVGDWEMWWRMSRMGLKFKLIPHVLCIYVEHQDTVSNSDNTKLESQKVKLIQQYSK